MLWQQWGEFKNKKANPNPVSISSNASAANQSSSIASSLDGVGVPLIATNLNNQNPDIKNVTPVINVGTSNNTNTGESLGNISVETDNFLIKISKQGANIVFVELKKQKKDDGEGGFVIIDAEGVYQYSARSGLVSNTPEVKLPSHNAKFIFEKDSFVFNDGDKWQVDARAEAQDGVEVIKSFIFYKNRYDVEVSYKIINNTANPLVYSDYYLLNRNGELPKVGYFGLHTYTGPAYYTAEQKFNKADFKDISKKPEKYRFVDNKGWVALIQHYFVSAWVKPEDTKREIFLQPEANSKLYSAGIASTPAPIAAGASATTSAKIYIGPQDQDILAKIAEGLQLVIDYGIFTIFAEPLFWVMKFIYSFVGNWGWTIILLTILIKAIFYPLSAASFKSMAKMRKVTPKMQRIRELYADDKTRQQQEMIKLYQTEKVNPLGGCLPILVQIPVFISLYWVLLSSVEMRNQPWLGWIVDLAKPDPYFILPVLYAISMFITTKLNPPPPDPMQRKILMAMPIVFSVMFFFFPAGLVLYWVVNNVLTIFQQYYNNKKYGH